MARLLSMDAHGAIDWLSVVSLVVGPRALGWNRRFVSVVDILAGATVAYSLSTDYELGAFRIPPMPAHHALDGANALTTPALPRLLGIRDRRVAACRVAVAAFGAIVTLSMQTAADRWLPGPEFA